MLAAPAFGLDANRTINQYGHESWTSQRGLPGEAVYEILQTPDGYLWLRTSGGLVRFDGMRFARIDPSVDKAPFDESVRAIALGADADMLVRGTSKTLVYKNGAFYDYLNPLPLPDGSTRRVYESKQHDVWVGADDFIYRLKGNRVEMVKRGTGWVDSMLQDREGNLWIGGGGALYRFRNDVLSLAPISQPGLAFPALMQDSGGTLWLGTSKGLYSLESGTLVAASTLPELMHDRVSSILEDRHHNIWVGTSNSGLFRLAAGKWTTFSHADGLTDDGVLSLAEDREGDLWVGTTSGLEEFRDVSVKSFTKAEGLLSNNTSTLLATKPIDRAKLSQTLAKHLEAKPGSEELQAAHPAAQRDTQDIVDWESLKTITDGDAVYEEELVQLFIESGDAALRDIRDAVTLGDLGGIQRGSHVLKGASANIHAQSASRAAARLEDAARAGAHAEIASLEAELRRQTQRTFEVIRQRRA